MTDPAERLCADHTVRDHHASAVDTRPLLRAVIAAAPGLLFGAAILFAGALFLDWERAGIDVAGVVRAEGGRTGWAGWGWAGGVCALAIIALELARRRRRGAHPVAVLLLAFGMVAATLAAIAGTDRGVQVAAVTVGVETTRWPAWSALALAVLAVLSAAAALRTDQQRPDRPPESAQSAGKVRPRTRSYPR